MEHLSPEKKTRDMKLSCINLHYKGGKKMGHFMDFDKYEGVVYNNLWLDEEKIVVKMPVMEQPSCIDLKIEGFDLQRYTYLLHY